MIFDDYFYRLTGGIGVDGKEVIREINPFVKGTDEHGESVVLGLKQVGASSGEYDSYSSHESESTQDNYERHPDDYTIESDLIFPKINRAVRTSEKPVVLVIDDDFPTLDLLKIYLMRDYEYVAFSSAKEGLLYLNDNVVDLILFDCSIHTTKSEKVVKMIRQFRHCKEVPIIYMGDTYEIASVINSMPGEVCDTLKRPVARGDLQKILDKYIKKEAAISAV